MHHIRSAAIASLGVLALAALFASPAGADDAGPVGADLPPADAETIIVGVVETVGAGATIEITPSGDTDERAAPIPRPVRARALAVTGDHTLALFLLGLAALLLGTVMVRTSGRARIEAQT